MTVAELIAKLRTFPPEIEVYVDSNDYEDQIIAKVFLHREGKASPGFVCIDCGQPAEAQREPRCAQCGMVGRFIGACSGGGDHCAMLHPTTAI
jgi:hypothetical protein